MSTVSKEIVQERQPFDIAWRTVDGLKIRLATDGKGDEKVVLFSPWPESILAFTPVWGGLTARFEVLAIDLPGFGRSEARDDLFAPQRMGGFIAKALDAFGLTSVHAVGLDVGSPSVLFAALARPELFRSLIVGAGASTYPLAVEGALKSMIEAEGLPSLNAVEETDVVDHDRQQHDRSHADPPGQWPFLRVPALRLIPSSASPSFARRLVTQFSNHSFARAAASTFARRSSESGRSSVPRSACTWPSSWPANTMAVEPLGVG
jgi:pimeloyl-ACP methyl ester carboxylesterase